MASHPDLGIAATAGRVNAGVVRHEGSTSQYQFQVNDLFTGGSLQVTAGCLTSCPNSVALALSQPGNLGGGVVPDFTMINFTGTTVDANFGAIKGTLAAKRGSWTRETLEETSPSVVKPSALQGGRAFSNTCVSYPRSNP